MSTLEIPDKLYFRIGEVSKIVGVKPYVLRFWETEFSSYIKPQKSKSNHRMYQRRDIESLLKIKELLYEKRYTISGARDQMKQSKKAVEADPLFEKQSQTPVINKQLMGELRGISDSLRKLAVELKRESTGA